MLATLAAADGSVDNELASTDGMKTTIVADVHTDPNSGKVLEAGSGPIDWLVVVNKLADGTLVATVGPIFSYYQFAWPMNDRLTDDKWRTVWQSTARPALMAGLYP